MPTRLSLFSAIEKSNDFLRLIFPGQKDRVYTGSELVSTSSRWAAAYSGQKLRPGERVVIILHHSLDLYGSYLGAVLNGQIPAFFTPPSFKHAPEVFNATISTLLETVSPSLIVTDPEIRNILTDKIKSALPVIIPDEIPDSPSQDAGTREFSENDTAFIQFSSGTTGIKKGVTISFKSLLWQITAYGNSIGLSGNDRIVSWLPLYHDMGLVTAFWMPLLKGIPLVAMSPLDWVRNPSMLLHTITKYKGTLCWLPNFAYHHIKENYTEDPDQPVDLSSLRGIINCSEPVRRDTHRMFLEAFSHTGLRPSRLWTCYAMAENVFAVTGTFGKSPMVNRVDRVRFETTDEAIPPVASLNPVLDHLSSGSVLPDTSIRIETLDGKEAESGSVGEILIKSPALFSGYLNNETETSKAFSDGWYRTGDLGYIFKNHLFVTGRKNDLIIINGKNIYPRDIEYLVNTVPGTKRGRCAAFSIPNKNRGTDDLIIVTEREDSADEAALATDIREAVSLNTDVTVADIRVVRPGWLIKSTSGKISRYANRSKYLREVQPATAPTELPDARSVLFDKNGNLMESVLQLAKDIIQKNGRSPDAVSYTSPLITSGLLDSLSITELILSLEKQLAVTIPDKNDLELSNFDSVSAIARFLKKECNPQLLSNETRAAIRNLRQYKCELFHRSPRNFDTAILGSSKSLPISTAVMDTYGLNAFNFSVNSANAEDWYCIYRYIKETNAAPLKRIFICLDIEAFKPIFNIDLRLASCRELSQYLTPSDQESLREMYARLSADKDFLQKKMAIPSMEYTFGPSGDLKIIGNAPQQVLMQNREPLHYDGPEDNMNAEYNLKLSKFTHLGKYRLMYLRKLCMKCGSDRTQIVLFIPPYMPGLAYFLLHNTTYKDRMHDLLGIIGKIMNPLLLLFNYATTDEFGGIPDDFIDPAHMGNHNADLLTCQMLESLGLQKLI